jgi:hypothetical protein
MLRELFTYLTTPCPRHVRGMGYLYEAIALRARHARCKDQWRNHLALSRQALLQAAAACRMHGTVVILGSGLLLDVPLHELANMFAEVVLIDIVHLPHIRRYVQRFDNVRLAANDVSFIAARLFEDINNGRPVLPEPATADVRFGTNPSLVISLNILSQLPVLPRRYAKKHMPGLEEDDLEAWCRRIIATHYTALRALSCDVCLIADHGYTKRDRQGAVIEAGSTIHGFELPAPASGWTWPVAPLGEESQQYAKELQVGVWHTH